MINNQMEEENSKKKSRVIILYNQIYLKIAFMYKMWKNICK